MSGAAQLTAHLDAFARTIDDLRAIAGRDDPGRRAELIALRRQLSERIVSIRDIGVQTFADPAVVGEFRSRLSVAMNRMALHQANWPAVSIDGGNAAYRSSAQQVAETNRAFIDWTRAALAGLG